MDLCFVVLVRQSLTYVHRIPDPPEGVRSEPALHAEWVKGLQFALISHYVERFPGLDDRGVQVRTAQIEALP